MIHYPNAEYLPTLYAELRDHTQDLWSYKGGTGVDFEKNTPPLAFAINISLLHDPGAELTPGEPYMPSADAHIALAQSASRHGKIGTFSGVSGYLDQPYDFRPPQDRSEPYDPVRYAVEEELQEECQLSLEAIRAIRFFAAESYVLPRTQFVGSKIRIVPLLGWCASRPELDPNPEELHCVQWESLATVARRQDLAKGYCQDTLPRTFSAVGTPSETLAALGLGPIENG